MQLKVMVYVDHPEACEKFWIQDVGFVLKEEGVGPEETKTYFITTDEEASFGIRLFKKDAVARFSPEISLATPSLLFGVRDVRGMHDRLAKNGVTVTDVMTMGDMTTFSFCDLEGHYFAVKGV
jgi:lactoylglutathione lyase